MRSHRIFVAKMPRPLAPQLQRPASSSFLWAVTSTRNISTHHISCNNSNFPFLLPARHLSTSHYFSSSNFCCDASLVVGGGGLSEQRRFMNVSQATQRKMSKERQESPPSTEYDLDKESWSKNMKFASMECVIDPDINEARLVSFTGIKKLIKRWLTLKKLKERRPDYDLSQLRDIYIRYKETSMTKNPDKIKDIARLTTFSESQRLQKEQKARLNKDFLAKSWKSLKMQNFESGYEIEIEFFDYVNCYLGAMSEEDWLQITIKCVGKERNNAKEDWVPFEEYPVFEVRLGDGVRTQNTSPFIVVAVMDKDGIRRGKDGQDATLLRKQLAKTTKWWR